MKFFVPHGEEAIENTAVDHCFVDVFETFVGLVAMVTPGGQDQHGQDKTVAELFFYISENRSRKENSTGDHVNERHIENTNRLRNKKGLFFHIKLRSTGSS